MRFSERLDALEMETEEVTAKAPSDSEPGSERASDNAASSGAPAAGEQSDEKDGPDPLILLLQAHRVVERSINRALERHGLSRGSATSPSKALKLLSTRVDIDPGLRAIVASLVTLRNEAVHEDVRVKREDADRYSWVANDIADYLDRL